MKVLLTGASGFLGTEIKSTLSSLDIVTLSRNDSDILIDLSKAVPELPKFDIVVHAAGKAHSTPKSKLQIDEFEKVNVLGTKNLLKGLEANLPSTLVFISSVAVYGKDEGLNISEDTPLGAKSPYGLSKAKAESLVLDWGKLYNVDIVILRLPLVIGRDAPGNLGALIKAISRGYYFRIGRGNAKKSMVLAHDVAMLIPNLKSKSGIYNLTDGYNPSFKELDTLIAEKLKIKIKSVPYIVVKVLAIIGDFIPILPLNRGVLKKMETSLTFSCKKASTELNWKPNMVLKYNWFK